MQNVLGKTVKMELLQEVYVQAYMYKLNCIVIIDEINFQSSAILAFGVCLNI